MFILEALEAKHGDALLLHYGSRDKPRLAVIDGGPGGVYAGVLEPRLNEIRDERGLGDDEPLDIELMMVSHLDADHITGILQLMRKLRDRKQAQKPLPWKIQRFWHNAFPDLAADEELGKANAASITASFGDVIGFDQSGLLASVGQGRELRDLANVLGVSGNKPFNSIVKFPHQKNPVKLPDLELTVVGPDEKNLKLLQEDWNKKVKALLQKKEKEAKVEVAAYLDKSVYNLSSIVVLAKSEGKTMLLTGDARGNYTLDALRGAGILKDEPLQLDVLKLPHHGSDRNVEDDYFELLQAKHYVISADGRHGNPDVATLEMIRRSRNDNDFTVWMTNAPEDFGDAAVGTQVAKFLAKSKLPVKFRKKNALGVTIDL